MGIMKIEECIKSDDYFSLAIRRTTFDNRTEWDALNRNHFTPMDSITRPGFYVSRPRRRLLDEVYIKTESGHFYKIIFHERQKESTELYGMMREGMSFDDIATWCVL